MPKQPDYYRVLGIAPSSDEATIKRAYRALAKRYHPDAAPPAHREWARERMARINQAYDVLRDPVRRAQYDRQQGYRRDGEHLAASSPDGTLWRRQRARERSRRQHMERWRAVTLVSAAVLLAGLLMTLIFVRTPLGYVLSTLANGSALAMFFVSLIMANR